MTVEDLGSPTCGVCGEHLRSADVEDEHGMRRVFICDTDDCRIHELPREHEMVIWQ